MIAPATEELKPREYQLDTVNYCMHRFDRGLSSGIFADPGLGKTFMAYELIQQLRWFADVKQTLVVAPLQTCLSTWKQECQKFGFDLEVVVLHGNKKNELLHSGADVFVINPEGLKWLLEQNPRFDFAIMDESTLFKRWSAVRSQRIRNLLQGVKYRLILTGTPIPNSMIDLYPQIALIDPEGEALGKNISWFRTKYCRRGGYNQWGWEFRREKEQEVLDRIAPFIVRLDENDHLDLPEFRINPIWITLPNNIMKKYKTLERRLFLALDSGESLISKNAGAAYQACKQLANGGAYEYPNEDNRRKSERRTHHIHYTKIERLQDLHEEINHAPLLTAFQYDHDADRLSERFENVPLINGATPKKTSSRLINKWNQKRLEMLAVHPASLSHGVNLQFGGHHLAWVGLTDNPEQFFQLNKRLHRSGQERATTAHLILARDTVDEAILNRLNDKEKDQNRMLHWLREYRKK